jgi:hypothetical protein
VVEENFGKGTSPKEVSRAFIHQNIPDYRLRIEVRIESVEQ